MIQKTATGVRVSTNGPVVYLDNWAFIELAKKDPARRARFIYAIHSGFDLLFSVTNAAELSGPQGVSAAVIRDFLDAIGPRWFPARHDVMEIIKLELVGGRPEEAFIDEDFFKSVVADQMRRAGCADPRDLSSRFFRLGPVVDQLGPQRQSICQSSAAFDQLIKSKLTAIRRRCKGDPGRLARHFPAIPFNHSWPANFVFQNLLRVMAFEANSLKKGDGFDFCHAVVGYTFASIAALDTHWKRRLACLPPNPLARVYSPLELDKMVTDMESCVARGATG